MLTTRARIGVAALLAIVGSSMPALAIARLTTTHKWSATWQEVTISTANGYPNPGATVFSAGALTASRFGTGAFLDYTTITGHPRANVYTFKGTEIDFFAQGTERNTYAGTDTVQADGRQVLVDTARFTGGTGRYRDATGRYTFTGTVPAGSSVTTGHGTGSITY